MRVGGAVILAVLLAAEETVFAVNEANRDVGVEAPAQRESRPLAEPSSPPTTHEPPAFVTMDGGRLNLLVENRSLAWILEEISRKSGVVVNGAEAVPDAPVSVQLTDIPLDQGLRELLKAQDVFYFYRGDEKGGDGTSRGEERTAGSFLQAVWIFPKGEGRRMAPIPPELWASSRELKQGLSHPDAAERARTIESLVERNGEQARDDLLRALRDRDDQVRERALNVALASGVPLPASLLEELVQGDPSPAVRFLALGAIGIGSGDAPSDDPHIKTVAELALKDPDPDVQEQARQILEQLDQSSRPPDPEPRQGAEDPQ